MGTWIGLGVLAFVAHIIWKRLKALESETSRLTRTVQALQAEARKAASSYSIADRPAAAPREAQQGSLPLEKPAEEKSRPQSPVPEATPPQRPAVRPAADVTSPASHQDQRPRVETPAPQPPPPPRPAAATAIRRSARQSDGSAPRPKNGSVPSVARTETGSAQATADRPGWVRARLSELAALFRWLAADRSEQSEGGFWDAARRLWRGRLGLERNFGAKLAVWVGGAALAMAGFFLVTYSIELGLMTPAVRMVLGGAFGIGLLAASEAVHRRPQMANGSRISQALAGAGIADLYAMLYIATSVFGLLPPTIGFLGLAMTTATALLLALRLGLPTAVMGLVGGFATPAMVGTTDPNIPVLLAYLFMVIGGLHLLIRHRGWWWLGLPVTLGGFGWVGLLLASDVATQHSTSLGIFLLGVAGMAFLSGGHRKSMPLGQVLRDARTLTPLITGGIALAQLALVVGVANFGWLDWGLFGLLAAACVAMGLYDDNSAMLPPIALIVSIGLIGLSPSESEFQLSVVAAIAVVLFAAAGYWQTWRGRRPLLWLGLAATASFTIYAIAYVKLHGAPYQFGHEPGWAAIALLLALPAAATAVILLNRRNPSEEQDDRPAMLAGGTASAFIAAALLLAVPRTFLPLAFAVQAAATALAARRLRSEFVNWYNIAVGALFLAAFIAVPTAAPLDAARRLLTASAFEPAAGLIDTLVVYLIPALVMAATARISTLAEHRAVAGWATTILVALGLAASLPGMLLPFAYALQALVTVATARRLRVQAADLYAFAAGVFLVVAVITVPDATPLDALARLLIAGSSEPAAAAIGDMLWVYLLPASLMAAAAGLSSAPRLRATAAWMATGLVGFGLAASVPGMQLPAAFAFQALATMVIAGRLRAEWLMRHGFPLCVLLVIAVITVPTATPLHAVLRLFAVGASEPAAAGLIDTLWVYLMPALAMAAIARFTAIRALRSTAGWMATALLAIGLASSVPGMQLPVAYALQLLTVVAIARRSPASGVNLHAMPLAALFAVAVIAVPSATPMDALVRLFSASAAEPAAATLTDALWAYLLPAVAFAAVARVSGTAMDRRAAEWTVTALVAFALAAIIPGMQLPLAFAIQGLATLVLARRLRAGSLTAHAGTLGVPFAIAFLAVPDALPLEALLRLVSPHDYAGPTIAFVALVSVFVLPALAAAASARLVDAAQGRIAYSAAAVGLTTLALAAVVPADWLALAITLEALLLVVLANRLEGYRLQYLAAVPVLGFLVQFSPTIMQIAWATLPSLIGIPVYADMLPNVADFLRHAVLPSVPLALMVRFLPSEGWTPVRRTLVSIAAFAGALLPYIALKSVFGIDDALDFQSRGFIERALFTQLCFAVGALALHQSRREGYGALKSLGLGVSAVAIARLIWFDLAVFNPLVVPQQVGSIPLLNALLVAYGLPVLWLALSLRAPASLPRPARVAARTIVFALVPILVGYQVRQLFQGSLLIPGPVGTAELYVYSVAALATGIGFLLWGTSRRDRPARLISLALVLAAVAKVFLYDASELTGLWRVAAFAGLGFSLLGISWFYSRYVFVDRGRSSVGPEPEADTAGTTG